MQGIYSGDSTLQLNKECLQGTVGGFAVVDGVAIALTAAHNFKISR